MKALISPLESVNGDGFRIAGISESGFDVASPLYWIDVADDVSPELHYYVDGVGVTLIPVPEEPVVS